MFTKKIITKKNEPKIVSSKIDKDKLELTKNPTIKEVLKVPLDSVYIKRIKEIRKKQVIIST